MIEIFLNSIVFMFGDECVGGGEGLYSLCHYVVNHGIERVFQSRHPDVHCDDSLLHGLDREVVCSRLGRGKSLIGDVGESRGRWVSGRICGRVAVSFR